MILAENNLKIRKNYPTILYHFLLRGGRAETRKTLDARGSARKYGYI